MKQYDNPFEAKAARMLDGGWTPESIAMYMPALISEDEDLNFWQQVRTEMSIMVSQTRPVDLEKKYRG
ncbi:MAG: hypothetical protein JJ934_03065 [Pseudomonadales bacterium]|nr:hypothetical protein [Pseudomonadales bacterium]MBO6564858.1 hypothetical protein [Pseudomonadales bacterium]MBO6595261.1 hypothetical protein [Pseudomonadales bacterium]MBO6655844.1 hypothetical protein [Pseudomonadales bacterium]MBO6701769.1 hypothetical protein [Pseudomonadales bacterium]